MKYEFNAGQPAPFMDTNGWTSVAYGQGTCMVCNRKVGKKPYRVEVINGGDLRDQTKSHSREADAGYMGTWAVGSECAKKFDPAVLIKN